MCTVTKNHQGIDAVVILKISRRTQRMYALYDNDCWLVSVELSIQKQTVTSITFLTSDFYWKSNSVFLRQSEIH